MTHRIRRALCLAPVLIALLLGLPSRADHLPVLLLFETGDPAPSLPAGTLFYTLDLPTINASGELAFLATLTGGGVTSANDETVWAGPIHAPRLIAREGDPAPQTGNGATFARFYGPDGTIPVIADSGTVAFEAWLSDLSFGVYTYDLDTDTLERVIRDGDPAPNLPGVTFAGFGDWAFSDAGLAVSATLQGSGVTANNAASLWTGTASGLTKLLRAEEAAPGYAGCIARSFGTTNFTTNPFGETAFWIQTWCPPPSDSPWVIYSGVPGSLSSIAVFDQPSPVAGCTYYSTDQSANTTARSLGASGNVTFYSNVSCGGGALRSGVFQNGPGGAQTVATFDDLVGLGDATWSSLWQYPVGGGDILAIGGTIEGTSVDSTNDQVIFSGTAGAIDLLAREGDAAPGTGAFFSDFDAPQVDATGRIGIRAVLSDSVRGIWAGEPGSLDPVVLGDHPYGSGDRRRTLDADFFGPSSFEALALYGTGNADGLPGAMSDAGPIVFRSYAFTDGGAGRYGYYLPEPTNLPALLWGVVGVAWLARRQPWRRR